MTFLAFVAEGDEDNEIAPLIVEMEKEPESDFKGRATFQAIPTANCVSSVAKKCSATKHDSPGQHSPRRPRHDSPDQSPPRRPRHDSPDQSPPRRPRHDSPDQSPPRRPRHDSPGQSPPRRYA